jgi:hypothetical protein
MARIIEAFEQFFDNAGDPLTGGTVEFFKSGTSTPLTTYADSLLTIPNPAPVPITASGRPQFSVFAEGSAKAVLKDSGGVTIKEVDPIGGENVTGAFALYDPQIIYGLNEIVEGSDGKFYISLAAGNVGNDPTTPSPTKWSEIRFIFVYNASQTYSIGQVVQDATGNTWKSLTNSNLGNTPAAGANWDVAISSADVLTSVDTVIPQTGGGALTALRTNELRDADSGYTLPLANSVSVNQTITITLPQRYASGAIITRSGSDTIEGAISDTTITFNGPGLIILTSDGSSTWTL